MIYITRYSIKEESLKPWVKHIWYLQSENGDISNKLLPTDSIDIIINLSGTMTYTTDLGTIHAPPIHVNGIRDKDSYIKHNGNIITFGISLHSYGLYPFVNKDIKTINNRIITLSSLSPKLEEKLKHSVTSLNTTKERVNSIEKALLSELRTDEKLNYMSNLIRTFLESDNNLRVNRFCTQKDINYKTFIQNVQKYTGYTPKKLQRIKNFQDTCNELVHSENNLLSDKTCENEFSDQTHFSRNFRKLSGSSPIKFKKICK